VPNLARLLSSGDPDAVALAETLRSALDPKSKARGTIAQLLVPLLLRRHVVSPLAPDAVTLLLEAVFDGAPKRAQLLEALYAFGVGLDAEAALARRVDSTREDELLAEGLTLGRLRAPIVARSGDLLALLRDADAAVRASAALLASTLPGATASLEAALDEENDVVTRLVLLFALASHGVRKEVPEPPAKNAFAVVLARIVRVLQGGPIDLEAVALARKLPLTSPAVLGVPSAGAAVLYANIGEIVRRGDTTMVATAPNNATAAAVMASLWPNRRTPLEPRAALTDEERRWLLPLYQAGAPGSSPSSSASGIVRGAHVRRLLGMEHGPADERVDGTPLWLLARRVVDQRAPIDAWLRALEGKSSEERVAILRDLASYRTEEPWPDLGEPFAMPRTYETYGRYATLVRATLAELDDAALSAILAGPPAAMQATAMALLLERGRPVPESGDAQLAQLLAREQGANDLTALRALVQSLPEARRAAVLANVRPMATGSPDEGRVLLTNLWFYADLAPPPVLSVLINDLVAIQSLSSTPSKAKTPADAAMAQGMRVAVHEVFRSVGAPAVAPLSEAIAAQKPKSAARGLLEVALAGAEGRPLP
jgi:hypothetical protein